MNGFADRGLSEADFGDSKGVSVKSFDAFRRCFDSLIYAGITLVQFIAGFIHSSSYPSGSVFSA